VEGNEALREQFACTIIGPKLEADRIPGIKILVSGGDSFTWAGRDVRVLACPGHTKGHVAYHVPSEFSVFAGDTLFSLGCGRVFEGTLEEMYHSVTQFKAMSPSTYLYCGHEYTIANARFCAHIEPDNAAIAARLKAVEAARAAGRFTVPTTLAEEKATNVFVRAKDLAEFAARREAKNTF
jgi:hydroxyacylglutathione hydrolase